MPVSWMMRGAAAGECRHQDRPIRHAPSHQRAGRQVAGRVGERRGAGNRAGCRNRETVTRHQQFRQQPTDGGELEGIEAERSRDQQWCRSPQQKADIAHSIGRRGGRGRHHHGQDRDEQKEHDAIGEPQSLPAVRRQQGADQQHQAGAGRHVGAPCRQHDIAIARGREYPQQSRDRNRHDQQPATFDDADDQQHRAVR
jgi:hypothetical protein